MDNPNSLGNQTQIHIDLQDSQVNEKGEFEILAITAGVGNGWEFSTDVLKKSVQLWDGIESFIDHHWFGNSVHDLAGICYSPEWDEARQGVKLKLRPIGPGAAVLKELGQSLLSSSEPKPKVGFSADLVFTAAGKKVDDILRVFSVDLVVNPARGGEFIRQVYSKLQKQKEYRMSESNVGAIHESPNQAEQPTLPTVQPLTAQIKKDQDAVRSLLDEHGRIKEIQKEAENAREMRQQMCGHFLESALQASKLPAPAQDLLRNQFKDRVFEAEELQKAIGETRGLISELTAGSAVQGPRISAVFNSADKLQAAVDDLLGAPRTPEAKALQVAPLSGIRELYLMLTGDYDLHGGYNA